MAKNLHEAAAEVLNKSRASGHQDTFGLGATLNNKPPGQGGVVDLGQAHVKQDSEIPDYTRGVPHATPPGQTPPVGAQPPQKVDDNSTSKATRKDLAANPQKLSIPPSNSDSNRDRKKSVKDTVSPGKGNVWQENEKDEDQEYYMLTAEEIDELIDEGRTWKDDEKSEKAKSWKDQRKSNSRKEEKAEKKITAKEAVEEILAKNQETVTEDVEAIFQGETLSEEFKTRATTVFEAAVNSRVAEVADLLEDSMTETMNETIETLQAELTEQIDEYLNYMVQEWLEQNEVAIEKGLRAEIVEDFIGGLKSLFIEHYIDIPEDKVDLVGELQEQVSELEEKLNDQIKKNMDVSKELGETKKEEILNKVCEGLTQIQKDKIRSLTEATAFTNPSDFGDKVQTLVESYFPSGVKTPSKDSLNTDQMIVEEEKPSSISPDMQLILKTLKTQVR